ncbi:MAG: hypothetical protein AB7E73_02145 [Burkholderiales bacterium]
MAYCPSCSTTIATDAQSCEQCGANFGPGSSWKPLEQLHASVPEYRPWILTFLGFFLLADAIFVSIHQNLNTLLLPSNYSLEQRIVTYTFVYSAQFLGAFSIGMILSLAYGFVANQRGRVYRQTTWMRALAIALLPAAILFYGTWLATQPA